jgi:hypothetical protein
MSKVRQIGFALRGFVNDIWNIEFFKKPLYLKKFTY